MPLLTRALSLFLCLALWLGATPVPVRAAFFSGPAFSQAEAPAPASRERELLFPKEATGNIRAAASTPNTNNYPGEQLDGARGLYYLRARLLNPLTGRFWSADSYEGEQRDTASLHKYTYAYGAPVLFGDPSGYSPATELGIAVHGFLYLEFAAESEAAGFDTVLTNRSIRRVIGNLLQTTGPLAFGSDLVRPDLINGTNSNGWVYEIKPGGFGDVSENIAVSNSAQLNNYIGLLQANTPPGSLAWGKGAWWTSNTGGVRAYPGFVGSGVPPGSVLVTYANYAAAPGAVTYSFIPTVESVRVTEEEKIRIRFGDRLRLGLQDISLTPYISRKAYSIAYVGIAAVFIGIALDIERSASTHGL